MALSIAILDESIGTRLCHYALLCKYMDTGLPWLTDPQFVSNLPCTTMTPDGLGVVTRKTIEFIRGSCKDILHCCLATPGALRSEFNRFFDEPVVTFVHRTMFDYLHTPEMQLLLDEHTPRHFKDALFCEGLQIATCKVLVVDPCNPSWVIDGCQHLRDCTHCLPKWDDPGTQLIGVFYARKSFDLTEILKRACVSYYRAFEKVLATMPGECRWDVQRYCTSLAVALAKLGVFTFAEILMDVGSQLLGSGAVMLGALYETLYHGAAFSTQNFRMLLQAGANPNWISSGSIDTKVPAWTAFLGRARRSKYVMLPQEKGLKAVVYEGSVEDLMWEDSSIEERESEKSDTENQGSDDASDTDAIATGEGVFRDPKIQDVIKSLIEFGAELTPKRVEMLEKYLPKPDGSNFDWPEFLSTYSQPAKRIELDEDRRKRLRRWPEIG